MPPRVRPADPQENARGVRRVTRSGGPMLNDVPGTSQGRVCGPLGRGRREKPVLDLVSRLPFSEGSVGGSFSLGGVAIMGMRTEMIHDVRHGSRVPSVTLNAPTPAAAARRSHADRRNRARASLVAGAFAPAVGLPPLGAAPQSGAPQKRMGSWSRGSYLCSPLAVMASYVEGANSHVSIAWAPLRLCP